MYFDHREFDGHEQVAFCHDPESGLKAIIAVHSTARGPSCGGCRMWPYASDEDALYDVLRLSKGMSYKNAMAGLRLGGGKAVIFGHSKKDKTEALFRAFGRMVERLNGSYITAEDVGITVDDMANVAKETAHVTGMPAGSALGAAASGDPSPMTAIGVFSGIVASVKHRLSQDSQNGSLAGVRVAVQGLGHVGQYLCGHLAKAGAQLIVTDIDEVAVKAVVAQTGATAVAPDAIYDQAAEVFAPCALGAILNDATLPRLKVPIVAGAANNQLAEPRHGEALLSRGILYAPDYVINAGGIINVSFEIDGHYDRAAAETKTRQIAQTLLAVYTRAEAEKLPTNVVADRMAREHLVSTGTPRLHRPRKAA